MPSKDFGEDAAFFLYMVPVVAAVIYGAYEWAAIAHTSTMPELAYLIVAKSQYLFLLALIAICAGVVLEVRSAGLPEREGIIQANTFRLQILAVVVLIISFAAALSVADYSFGSAFSEFLNGRYPIIYAFFLIGLSVLLTPRQVFGNVKISSLPEIVGLILLAVSPAVFYLGTKANLPFAASAAGGLIIAIVGLVFLLGVSSLIARGRPRPVSSTQRPPQTTKE